MTDSRLSTAAVEALTGGNPDRRATAVGVEALGTAASVDRRATAVGVDALATYDPDSLVCLLAIEVLTPTALVTGIAVDLDVATDTNEAEEFVATKVLTLAPATDTNDAQAFSGAKVIVISPATDTNDAQIVRATRPRDLDAATDTSSAGEISPAHSVRIEPATQTEGAMELADPQYLVALDLTVGTFRDPRWAPSLRDRVGRLWKGTAIRAVHPRVQNGLLLWRDGTVLEVSNWHNHTLYESADDRIAGGTLWIDNNTSWQARVLDAAGYTLVPVDPENVTLEEEGG